MLERDIEKKLVAAAKKADGMALKFVSPGWDGVPDRIILFPGGHMAFVEVKAPGRKLRPIQEKRKEQIEAMGFKVHVLDGIEEIDKIIDEIGGEAE